MQRLTNDILNKWSKLYMQARVILRNKNKILDALKEFKRTENPFIVIANYQIKHDKQAVCFRWHGGCSF